MAINVGKLTSTQIAAHIKGWKAASKLISALGGATRTELDGRALMSTLSMGDSILAARITSLKSIAEDAKKSWESLKASVDTKEAEHKKIMASTQKKSLKDKSAKELKELEAVLVGVEAALDKAEENYDTANA